MQTLTKVCGVYKNFHSFTYYFKGVFRKNLFFKQITRSYENENASKVMPIAYQFIWHVRKVIYIGVVFLSSEKASPMHTNARTIPSNTMINLFGHALGLFDDFVDSTNHVKSTFWQIIVCAR